jgi:hypothetical protein
VESKKFKIVVTESIMVGHQGIQGGGKGEMLVKQKFSVIG